jgi:hypothetical protein
MALFKGFLMEQGVRDVRHPIHLHRIFMHVPKILCGALDTQASERPSLRLFAGEVMQDLHLDFREFAFRDCPKRGVSNTPSVALAVYRG